MAYQETPNSLAEPGFSLPGPGFEVTHRDTEDALHTPPRVARPRLQEAPRTHMHRPRIHRSSRSAVVEVYSWRCGEREEFCS